MLRHCRGGRAGRLNADRPARIVLLPGLDGTGHIFRAFLERTPACFAPTVVALPQDGPMGYDLLADRLSAEVEQAADGSPAVLLGESFAGPLALGVATRLPNAVAALVLAVTFVEPPSWRGFRHLVHHTLFTLRPPGLGFRWALAGRHATPELLADVRKARRAAHPRAMAERLRIALSVDAREALRRVPVPVLALHGGRDHLVPPRAARAMARAGGDVEHVTLDGPHLLLQTRPDDCWAAIEDFVRRRTDLLARR